MFAHILLLLRGEEGLLKVLVQIFEKLGRNSFFFQQLFVRCRKSSDKSFVLLHQVWEIVVQNSGATNKNKVGPETKTLLRRFATNHLSSDANFHVPSINRKKMVHESLVLQRGILGKLEDVPEGQIEEVNQTRPTQLLGQQSNFVGVESVSFRGKSNAQNETFAATLSARSQNLKHDPTSVLKRSSVGIRTGVGRSKKRRENVADKN